LKHGDAFSLGLVVGLRLLVVGLLVGLLLVVSGRLILIGHDSIGKKEGELEEKVDVE